MDQPRRRDRRRTVGGARRRSSITDSRDAPANTYTQIGIVLLVALASKNAILIVEFASEERRRGVSIGDAAVNAARLRFRAILMTAFSSILGFLPLLIASGAGAASRQAVGNAVVGGMIAATVFLATVCSHLLRRLPATCRVAEASDSGSTH